MEIESQDITVNIGRKNIIEGINLSVSKRQFVGIIGPNGSGKSTFLKCVYRILKPSKGVIYFDQFKQAELSVKASAKKVAVVSQHNYYNFDFKVIDVVLMGRSPHKKIMEGDTEADYQIAYSSLKIVGMESFAERNFSTLSGGEQQRVILARALTQQTECIVLDEPTNHLDIKYQLQFMDIVRSMDISVVAAIHDLNIAAEYCDMIYAMKDGKIFGEGTPESLLTEEFIYRVFEVRAEIVYDKNGKQVIVYRSDKLG